MINKNNQGNEQNDLNGFNVKVEEKKEEPKIDVKEEINIDNLLK